MTKKHLDWKRILKHIFSPEVFYMFLLLFNKKGRELLFLNYYHPRSDGEK